MVKKQEFKNEDSDISENDKYPKSIFLIIAAEFCERFSFGGLRAILSLYLRNVLHFHENVATYIYHGFIMLCYFVPVFGAVLADGYLGRFQTIVYFSVIYTIGNILICVAATPPISILPITWTTISLFLIAIGSGGIKPCVAAFGGDQFHLPRQAALLAKFFSLFYFTINLGSLGGVILIPILRNARCFHMDTCYSLGFGFPAALMVFGLMLFLLGKDFYRIKSPKNNVILRFLLCTFSALFARCRKGFYSLSKRHWLEYASEKYDRKLIIEMKTVYAILWLYIPLPIFWALFDQQGSRWTFQASRMDGELLGVQMLPDQLQMLNPVIVLILIPLMDKFVYPIAKRKSFLNSPLERMAIGGSITTLSFVFAGLLEIILQNSYPVLPEPTDVPLNLINTLPCRIKTMASPEEVIFIEGHNYHIFRNFIEMGRGNFTKASMTINTPKICGSQHFASTQMKFDLQLVPGQSNVLVLYEKKGKLKSQKIEPDIIVKPLNGKARVRVLLLLDSLHEPVKLRMEYKNSNKFKNFEFTDKNMLRVSQYLNLLPGRYEYFIISNNKILGKQETVFKIGGVYTLILHESHHIFQSSYLLEITPPNSVHMAWMIPQYLTLSLGEVLFAISGLQFSFTEAPKSMKTVVIAAWYLTVAAGNLLVILITQITIHFKQAVEFFVFAILAALNMTLFVHLATRYQSSGIGSETSTAISGISPNEHSPLLMARASVESMH